MQVSLCQDNGTNKLLGVFKNAFLSNCKMRNLFTKNQNQVGFKIHPVLIKKLRSKSTDYSNVFSKLSIEIDWNMLILRHLKLISVMHILNTVHYTFLTRRICLTIESFFSWSSFPLFLCPLYVIQTRYCKEKLEFSHSKGWKSLWLNQCRKVASKPRYIHLIILSVYLQSFLKHQFYFAALLSVLLSANLLSLLVAPVTHDFPLCAVHSAVSAVYCIHPWKLPRNKLYAKHLQLILVAAYFWVVLYLYSVLWKKNYSLNNIPTRLIHNWNFTCVIY